MREPPRCSHGEPCPPIEQDLDQPAFRHLVLSELLLLAVQWPSFDLRLDESKEFVFLEAAGFDRSVGSCVLRGGRKKSRRHLLEI